MKTRLLAILAIVITIPGCNSGRQSATPTDYIALSSQLHSTSSAIPTPSATGQSYDFYLLNLSWSPEFCYSHRDSPECASHPGFVVHGLWPQNNDGTYPEHCPSRPGPTSDAVVAGLMPTASLAQHEWQTHGTCTPYDADSYFELVRKAVNQVRIPGAFTGSAPPRMEPPAAIIDLFAQSNPSIPPGSIALSCGNNYLTAIEVCFDKSLRPTACQAIRTCRANAVKITPR